MTGHKTRENAMLDCVRRLRTDQMTEPEIVAALDAAVPATIEEWTPVLRRVAAERREANGRPVAVMRPYATEYETVEFLRQHLTEYEIDKLCIRLRILAGRGTNQHGVILKDPRTGQKLFFDHDLIGCLCNPEIRAACNTLFTLAPLGTKVVMRAYGGPTWCANTRPGLATTRMDGSMRVNDLAICCRSSDRPQVPSGLPGPARAG